jgi:chloramphenicol 3-O phosphotransferase
MNNVVIINGPSCAGKTSICKEICLQSNNKFVHLQIDKFGELYTSIFPRKFQFVKNDPGTENDDDGLKGLFNNNRIARRKVVASLLLSTAKELLDQNFSVVVDTAFDGPDAKDLAKLYLKYLTNYNPLLIGIYCPVAERLKRLKTRTDNLFLTAEFIHIQTDKYNVFELCKELYNQWFDSALQDAKTIASQILKMVV